MKNPLLWFMPLILALMGLSVLIADLKHPQVRHERCQVLGHGPSVSRLRALVPMLYNQGSSPVYDLALTCPQSGTVLLNDINPFSQGVAAGQPAAMTRLSYRLIPVQWRVSLLAPGA